MKKTWPAVGQLLIEASRAEWYKMMVAVEHNQKPSIYVLNFMKNNYITSHHFPALHDPTLNFKISALLNA